MRKTSFRSRICARLNISTGFVAAIAAHGCCGSCAMSFTIPVVAPTGLGLLLAACLILVFGVTLGEMTNQRRKKTGTRKTDLAILHWSVAWAGLTMACVIL